MKTILIFLSGAFYMLFYPAYSQTINLLPANISVPQPANLGQYHHFGTTPQGGGSPANYQNQMEQYERDVREYEMRKKQQEEILNEAYNSIYPAGTVHYKLPFNHNLPGVTRYGKAFNYLMDMMRGKQPMNLKDAVFMSEHAYDPGLSYDWYNKEIKRITDLCYLILKEDKHTKDNNLAKLMAIFKFMSDTVKYKKSFPEGLLTTYPMLYDFEDNYGRKDLHKQFITKLISQHTGQCHSMPLLFLIICEQMGATAYLSHAPEHTFIKFQDNRKKKWFNMELTCGRLSTDAFTINVGYVKADQIASGVYLDTMSAKETIADVLVDLAGGFDRKYGPSEFETMVADSLLKYYPKNTRALATKSVYYNSLISYVGRQLNYPKDKSAIPAEALSIFSERERFYRYLDAIDYEEISKEAYDQFQRMLESGKQMREHEGQFMIIKSMLSPKK